MRLRIVKLDGTKYAVQMNYNFFFWGFLAIFPHKWQFTDDPYFWVEGCSYHDTEEGARKSMARLIEWQKPKPKLKKPTIEVLK